MVHDKVLQSSNNTQKRRRNNAEDDEQERKIKKPLTENNVQKYAETVQSEAEMDVFQEVSRRRKKKTKIKKENRTGKQVNFKNLGFPRSKEKTGG